MASASKTPNLSLPQWVGTEKQERTDFNQAFDVIDTTVASHLAESVAKHIKESGTNTNGRYIKFDDGTMICWKEYLLGWGNAEGNLSSVAWTYPVAFISIPTVTYGGRSGNAPIPVLFYSSTIGTTSAEIYGYFPNGKTNYIYANPVAIGRWK